MSTGFVKVPNDVARCRDLDPYSFRVYVVLASHIGPQGWAMTLVALAEECRMSSKQVSRILPKLRERFGLEYRANRNGGYHFGWTDSPAAETHSPTGETHSPTGETHSLGGETHSPAETAPDSTTGRTHSPLREDSQSAPAGLTVLPTGTHLKEPEEPEEPRTSNAGARGNKPPKQQRPLRVLTLRETFTAEAIAKYPQWPPEKVERLIDDAVNYYLPEMQRGKYQDLNKCVWNNLASKAEREATNGQTQQHTAPYSAAGRVARVAGSAKAPPAAAGSWADDNRDALKARGHV